MGAHLVRDKIDEGLFQEGRTLGIDQRFESLEGKVQIFWLDRIDRAVRDPTLGLGRSRVHDKYPNIGALGLLGQQRAEMALGGFRDIDHGNP